VGSSREDRNHANRRKKILCLDGYLFRDLLIISYILFFLSCHGNIFEDVLEFVLFYMLALLPLCT
jgi:hypothetical protein